MRRFLKPNQMLLGSIMLATFSASLFWTGFPVYFQQLLGAQYSLPEVYAFAVSGSFLFSLVAGFWADRSNYRNISILSQLASAALVAIIFALCSRELPSVALLALPVLYLNFALGNVMESAWLFEKLEADEVQNKLLNRNLVLTGAKLVGFSLGPIVFTEFGSIALIFCALAFAIAGVVQLSIRKPNQPAPSTIRPVTSRASVRGLLKNPRILAAGILIGILSVPLNPIFAARAIQLTGESGASTFWLCAGISSIAGMVALKKFKRINWSNARWPFSIAASIAIAIALLANNALLVIGAASLYIFCLPLFSLEFQSRILKDDLNQFVGGKVGLINASIEGGIFFGMCAAAASEHLGVWPQLSGILVLILLRLVSFSPPGEKLTSRA